jgi:hypothetical protein
MWGSIGRGLPPASTLKAIRRHRHVCVMVFIMVCCFAICWLPLHVVHLYAEFGPKRFSDAMYVLKVFGHCLSNLNSALNPLIYSFMSHVFRQCCKAALADCYRCNPDLKVKPSAGHLTKGQVRSKPDQKVHCNGLLEGNVAVLLKVTESSDQNQGGATPRNTSNI